MYLTVTKLGMDRPLAVTAAQSFLPMLTPIPNDMAPVKVMKDKIDYNIYAALRTNKAACI